MAASWHPWHPDQDGHDRPGQLDLVAAIDLRGLALIFPESAPEANDAVGQQPGDDGEDNGADAQDKPGQVADGKRRGGGRGETFPHQGGRDLHLSQ
jgi:hypothetical protein